MNIYDKITELTILSNKINEKLANETHFYSIVQNGRKHEFSLILFSKTSPEMKNITKNLNFNQIKEAVKSIIKNNTLDFNYMAI